MMKYYFTYICKFIAFLTQPVFDQYICLILESPVYHFNVLKIFDLLTMFSEGKHI